MGEPTITVNQAWMLRGAIAAEHAPHVTVTEFLRSATAAAGGGRNAAVEISQDMAALRSARLLVHRTVGWGKVPRATKAGRAALKDYEASAPAGGDRGAKQ